jgi:hypothetical protein
LEIGGEVWIGGEKGVVGLVGDFGRVNWSGVE